MKSFAPFLFGLLFLSGGIITPQIFFFKRAPVDAVNNAITNPATTNAYFSTSTVDDVVAKANAFKALLSTSQINTLQQTFTNALAQKWSNLPCGSMCRNGLQFSTLTTAQLNAALDVIIAASGTTTNEGYDEFNQIRLADSVLGTVGGSGYSKGIYFISFLNAPSATGTWMLQFGGHHYAANIAFNGGKVVGTTPTFEGVEPKSFTVASGAIYAPINQERIGMQLMLASLSTAQLSAAKLSSTFSDVLLGPGQDGNFPATKQGLAISTLTTAQQNLVLAAMQPWLSDVDDASGAILKAQYQKELSGTYIAYASNNSAVAGDTSSFLKSNTDYVRIDGPSVWVEFVCQNGVVFSGVHYHSIYRDHVRDYGNYLARTSLPLRLLNFDVKVQDKSRTAIWTTNNEAGVDHYELERSVLPTSGFTYVGRTTALNNVSNSYSLTDDNVLLEGTFYYRLKMTDMDGYSSYSNVVAVKTKGTVGITLFPNPSAGTVYVQLPQAATNATLRVVNAAGKIISSKQQQTGLLMSIETKALAAGSYYVQVTENRITQSASFVKQ